MKKFINLLTVMLLFTANFYLANSKTDFPKYSKELTKSFNCSCSGAFTSCSASGTCTCSCGYFTCSCTTEKQVEAIAKNEIDISISEKQFKNIEKLAEKLHEVKADDAVNFLASMIENIRVDDAKSFYKNRTSYFQELKKLDSESKQKINEFFASVGAEERI